MKYLIAIPIFLISIITLVNSQTWKLDDPSHDLDVTVINNLRDFRPLLFGEKVDYYISNKKVQFVRGNCYDIYKANVEDATLTCRSIGKNFNLVAIEDEEEYRLLLPYLRSLDVPRVWTSGKKELPGGMLKNAWGRNAIEYLWESANKIPMTFKNFPKTMSISEMLQKMMEKGSIDNYKNNTEETCLNGFQTPDCHLNKVPVGCSIALPPCTTTAPTCNITGYPDCSIQRPNCGATCDSCTVVNPVCVIVQTPCTVTTPSCTIARTANPCTVTEANCVTTRPACTTTNPPCTVQPPTICPPFVNCSSSANQTCVPQICFPGAIICPSPVTICPPEQTTCNPPTINCAGPVYTYTCTDPVVNCPLPTTICTSPQVTCSSPVVNCPGIFINCPSPSYTCPSPTISCPPPVVTCPPITPCVYANPPVACTGGSASGNKTISTIKEEVEVGSIEITDDAGNAYSRVRELDLVNEIKNEGSCDDCLGSGCVALRHDTDFKWRLEECSKEFNFICEGVKSN